MVQPISSAIYVHVIIAWKGDVLRCLIEPGEVTCKIVQHSEDSDDECDDDNEHDDLDRDDDISRRTSVIFYVIQVGSIMALYTPTNVFEAFYLCKVVATCIAEKDISDADGHVALTGEKYFRCNYLRIKEKSRKSKYSYQYEILNGKEIIVYPAPVLSPFVNINEDYFLSMDEYQFLCDAS